MQRKSFVKKVNKENRLALPQFFAVEKSYRHPDMVGACVWIYCKKVLRDLSTWEQPGLAEPLGEVSSANTCLGSHG